jgi:hypothetical protein
MSPVNPRLIHLNHGVAHPGDEVNKIAFTPRLAQPNGIPYFNFETSFSEMLERRLHFTSGNKEVEVLGVTPDASVLMQGESAGNGIRHPMRIHQLEGLAICLLLFGSELGRRGTTNGCFGRVLLPTFVDSLVHKVTGK